MRIEEYEPGTPSWVELSSPDVDASKRFYGDLFGWSADRDPLPDSGGYCMLKQHGLNVARLGPAQPGSPPAWTGYVTMPDADQTAAAVERAGGSVLLPPMDVEGVGRAGIFADPTGAVIAVWEPRAHKGADLVKASFQEEWLGPDEAKRLLIEGKEPVGFCWNELQTRDIPAVIPFYQEVFGWKANAVGVGGEMEYTFWALGDRSIAAMMPMPEAVPAEVPAHWGIYFAVADGAVTAAKASELGATVLVPPQAIPVGTFAVLQDPQGAAFCVITFSHFDTPDAGSE